MNYDKAALRSALLEKRIGISIIQNAELSARISEHILALSAYTSAGRILCYTSFKNEVETRGLIRQALSSGKEIYLPVVRNATRMDAVRLYTPDDAMKKSKFGVWEPVGDEILPPDKLDFVLVPGVGFDKKGTRIGYGAGYYDRFLRQTQCVTVGMAFELQMVNEIPRESHDIRMNYVATEHGVYDCGNMED